MAFANYRKKLFNHNNINTQLRNKSMPCDAVTISNALKKAYLSEHLIVFRRLDKRENNIIGQVSVNHVFYCADFKGTHVGKKFLIFGKVDIICSY